MRGFLRPARFQMVREFAGAYWSRPLQADKPRNRAHLEEAPSHPKRHAPRPTESPSLAGWGLHADCRIVFGTYQPMLLIAFQSVTSQRPTSADIAGGTEFPTIRIR